MRFLLLFASLTCCAAPSVTAQSVHDVDSAVDALRAEAGFQFRAVASEPLVVDPVSAILDRHGRLWVVEMPDYPLGPIDGGSPKGRIKILEDIDGDGLFDRFDLFADGLTFATGVLPYRDGAFVTVSGAILFIRDADGDGTGDQTRVLFRGFTEQNQQLRANHPTLGPDGLVYIANGLRGGLVVSADQSYQPRDEPVDLRGHDFAFDPDGGWWGAVAGNSQFGMTIDDFGRRIGCSNRNPAMMAVLSLDAIERDPLLAARDAVEDIALAAEKSTVVSRGDAWTTSNLHSGQFSAACGVCAPGLDDRVGEWMVVCEPTAYLVQLQQLEREGSLWVARKHEQEFEFFSSSDSWFRPVDVTPGPGASLLVVDMARAVIEHPDFMPPELKQRPDQRNGDQLGRIWQVGRQGRWPQPRVLDSSARAVRWLNANSPWQRRVATQYLFETDNLPLDQLRNLLKNGEARPAARARAAWVLRRRKKLELDDMRLLVSAAHPRLRGLGVHLAGQHADGTELALSLADDNDPLVRRTVAAIAGSGTDDGELRSAALATTIDQVHVDAWIDRTVGSMQAELLHATSRQIASRGLNSANSKVLGHLVKRLAIESPQQAASVTAAATRSQTLSAPLGAAELILLQAWTDGCKRGRRSAAKSIRQLDPDVGGAMQRLVATARETALDDRIDPQRRANCLRIVLATGARPEDLRELFDSSAPPQLRAVMLAPLLRANPASMRSHLEENLAGMSLMLRAAALAACASRTEDALWMLKKVESGKLPRTLIDPGLAKRLRGHPDAEVNVLAEKLLRADPNRVKVLRDYASAANELGDPVLGQRLFVEHCSACHRIDGVGTNVGPDISDTRTKSADALLQSILDPNAAIDSAFVQFRILASDGRVLDGLLIDETAQAVTIQQKGGQRVVIDRRDIDRMQAPGVSLMPEGFEQTIPPDAMSHLLSYLKNWRYLKTTIPGTLPE